MDSQSRDMQMELRQSGCYHSSVDSSPPTILLPRVRVPSTPSTLLSFIVLVLFLSCDKNENKQKGLAHFLKKRKQLEHLSTLSENQILSFLNILTFVAFILVSNVCRPLPRPTACRQVSNKQLSFLQSVNIFLPQKYTEGQTITAC